MCEKVGRKVGWSLSSAACIYKGKCKDSQSTWRVASSCMEEKCVSTIRNNRAKLSIEETPYGCIYNKKCYKIGDYRSYKDKVGCYKYKCEKVDRKVGWSLSSAACIYKGRCKDSQSTWRVTSSCMEQKCVSTIRKNKAKMSIEETPYGCIHNKKCYKIGDYRSYKDKVGCYKYMCERVGRKVGWSLSSAACIYKGKCKDSQSTWRVASSCMEEKCVSTIRNNRAKLSIEETPYGCIYNKKCYKIGDYRSYKDKVGCYKYKCEKVGRKVGWSLSSAACIYKGKCKDSQSTWRVASSCMEQKCVSTIRNNRAKLSIEETPYGCKEGKTCKGIGSTWIDSKCSVHKCRLSYGAAYNDIVSTGCIHNKKCYKIGDYRSYKDKVGCYKYMCERVGRKVGWSLSSAACIYKGRCKDSQSTWRVASSCMEEKCVSTIRNNRAKLSIEETPYGCIYNKKCYKIGDYRSYKDKVGCYKYKCEKVDSKVGWSLSSAACIYKGRCKDSQSTWRVTSSCMEQKCVSTIRNNRAKLSIEETPYGCIYNKKCYKIGDYRSYKDKVGCYKYKCEKVGRKVGWSLSSAACIYKGKCKDSQSTWRVASSCMEQKCVSTIRNNRAKLSIEETPYGCKEGKTCKGIGSTWIDSKCSVHKCRLSYGAAYNDIVSTGCIHNKKCYKIGDYRSYKDKVGCYKYMCERVGRKVGWSLSSAACIYKGKCKDSQSTWRVASSCMEQKCVSTIRNNRAKLSIEETPYGCIYNKKCYKIGDYRSYKDKVGCYKYMCERVGRKVGWSLSSAACIYKGKCKDSQSTWRVASSCMEQKCVSTIRNNRAKLSIEETPYGCKEGKTCKGIGSTWIDSKCSVHKCRLSYGAAYNDIERTVCTDRKGVCKDWNSGTFEGVVNSYGMKTVFKNCICQKYGLKGSKMTCKKTSSSYF
ncbi:G surface protein, allelic form 156-like [Argopecten irradians]|uniref:G surface protein, allelic form 156-like n=1 Tax=Argopecten irradians TaxID=31199 RepID=UPI003712B934